MNKTILEKLFNSLNTLNIPYILIGGYAAAAWGYIRATKDIYVVGDKKNASRCIFTGKKTPFHRDRNSGYFTGGLDYTEINCR